MHWLVGMLVHAVCVFFYKGEKSVETDCGVFPNMFPSQHGAVDLDYIPLMSSLNLIYLFIFMFYLLK